MELWEQYQGKSRLQEEGLSSIATVEVVVEGKWHLRINDQSQIQKEQLHSYNNQPTWKKLLPLSPQLRGFLSRLARYHHRQREPIAAISTTFHDNPIIIRMKRTAVRNMSLENPSMFFRIKTVPCVKRWRWRNRNSSSSTWWSRQKWI